MKFLLAQIMLKYSKSGGSPGFTLRARVDHPRLCIVKSSFRKTNGTERARTRRNFPYFRAADAAFSLPKLTQQHVRQNFAPKTRTTRTNRKISREKKEEKFREKKREKTRIRKSVGVEGNFWG